MKDIVTVNTELPNIDTVGYQSGASLADYDIIVFDPAYPYFSRVYFSGGGSCIDINGGSQLKNAMRHWKQEIQNALSAHKTVFVLLNESVSDRIAVGSSSPRKGATNYNTSPIATYDVLPINLSVRNAKGRRVKVTDGRFKSLVEVLKGVSEYRVIIESNLEVVTYETSDGMGTIGGICSINNLPGRLVLVPYFDISHMVEEKDGEEFWNKDALRISKGVAGQLVAIDDALKSEVHSAPPPEWIESVDLPVGVTRIDGEISKIDGRIGDLRRKRLKHIEQKEKLLACTSLLYETGKKLELAIEETLRQMGYSVANFKDGALEIDHVFVGPSGLRMIGEAEGKDSSAVSISKFRQLESNINEDFARDEVDLPAKGVLFGNGFRFTPPDKRPTQFTDKCSTNAKRLGTALVRTSDLYRVALHILDNPKDEKFKEACRNALESTAGDIVMFPL